MRPTLIVATLLLCAGATALHAQDTTAVPDAARTTGRYLDAVGGKSAAISDDLDKQTAKYLSRFQHEEAAIYKKLAKKDTVAAAKGLAASQQQYAALQQKLSSGSQQLMAKGKRYMPLADTITSSLKFLQQYGDAFKKGLASSQQLSATLSQVNTMEDKFQQAEAVQAFIKARNDQLTQQLQQFNMGSALKPFSENAYYYAAQMAAYRAAFNSPDKAEQQAIALLNRLPAFQVFMQQHSQLAGLFSLPGNYANPAQSIVGLQTRSQVSDLIVQQLGAGPNAGAQFQQQVQAAQGQLDQFKSRLSQSGDADIAMPAGFAPNPSKTKTFLKKLVLGADLQTQRSSIFYPTVTDIALSVAYKPSDKLMAGIGASAKVGWGQDIRHVAVTVPGYGLRLFIDVKAVKSFYASGGLEYNYLPVNAALTNKYMVGSWTQSALIGVSKIVSVKSKFFKKTKLSLLWDMLSYRQQPSQNPIKFRVGYQF
jgi:uncharacterized protein YdbL (DUF1318 family)